MNIINKLKKVTILALTAILLTTLFAFSGTQVEVQAATNEVSMYYMDNFTTGWRGMYEQYIYIKVKNLGSNKKVAIHHADRYQAGVWIDEQAHYFKTLSDGSEIWEVYTGGEGTIRYAIKYEVNGTTYWDNNNGNNYNSDIDILGVNPVKNMRTNFISNSQYPVYAKVKNLAYNKVVKVRYTQDNWATSSEQELSYLNSIVGTNNEKWKTTLNIDLNNSNSFQYYIIYQVNGQTYYDNNFGINYNSNYYAPLN